MFLMRFNSYLWYIKSALLIVHVRYLLPFSRLFLNSIHKTVNR
uniref:Uncharacterized protein n=1 Tax=Siphoviridae sp. cttuu15 TaxID=2825709 RepID=A0A8S5U1E4_9CAUD|nr:MAG TPA: hypothetical protein [Siphoviridae sp. cttuu15]